MPDLGLNKTTCTGIKIHWGITGAYFTCNVILSVGSYIVGKGSTKLHCYSMGRNYWLI